MQPQAAPCDSIWKCFVVAIDMGLRKGDLGEALTTVGWTDPRIALRIVRGRARGTLSTHTGVL